MITINSKSELEQAIKQGQTEFIIADKKTRAATLLANKIRHFKASDLVPSLFKKKTPYWGAIAEVTSVAITLIVCVTAISIVAILKNYNVDLNIDPQTGKTTAKFQNS